MPDPSPLPLHAQLPPQAKAILGGSSAPPHDYGPAPASQTVPPHDPAAYDQSIDLRGEVCPYILMKTLLAFDGMDGGQVLRVLVNYLPALRGVPAGLTAYGHAVLLVIPLEGGQDEWQIYARRAARQVGPVRQGG